MSNSRNSFTDDDIDRIRSETIVQQVERFSQLPSTNDLALELAKNDSPTTPLLVLAERQTAGRGRSGNRWWSMPGSLTFSLVVDIAGFGLTRQEISQTSLVSALAVAASLRGAISTGDLQLKWPNDVYLSSRKIAGILLEPPPGKPDLLVIGVGINVNFSMANAPEEIRTTATSLYEATQKNTELIELLIQVVNQLTSHYVRLERGELDIQEHWRRYCMLAGRTVQLRAGTQQIQGLCQSVDDEGALLLQTDTGLRRFFSGTIEHIA